MISSTNVAQNYLKHINKDSLYDYLNYISSDNLEGRETTYKGQKLAALYLKNKLKYWKISPTDSFANYYQTFNINVQDFSKVSLVINNDTLVFVEDFYSFGNPINSIYSNVLCVDVGYGLDEKT